jgi:hypothetical protein
MAAFSGFFESHKPPPLGDTHGILPAHCNGYRNGQQSRCVVHRRFVIDVLAAARAIHSE